MIYKYYKNFIDESEINSLINFYKKNVNEHSLYLGVKKLNSPWRDDVREILEPKLAKVINTSENFGDNFYEHQEPYYPHVDNSVDVSTINVLIPLKKETQEKIYFIVFDQYVNKQLGITWVGSTVMDEDFCVNKKRSFPSIDSDVKGTVKGDFCLKFYEKYLKSCYRDISLFRGLTGTAVSWRPGDIIIFKSNHLHCSGKMHGSKKIGLSLRFGV